MTMMTARLAGSRFWLLLIVGVLLWGAHASQSRAESRTIGDYTVHYQAVNSTFLTPQIAEQYKITRSDRRAFINIAVLRNNPDGTTTPVAAKVAGGKRNLMQQTSDIAFQEIREGESIYYIGQFEFSNAETLRFVVDIQPEAAGTTHQIEWTTQLYSP